MEFISGERHTPYPSDIPLESLVIIGTIGLTLVVLVLSIFTTWITYKALKVAHK